MMEHELARYDAYKDSGIECIGKMPEHWDILPLKELASKSRGSFVDGPFGSDLKSNEYTDEGVPLIQLNNIGIGFHSTKNIRFISEDKSLSLSKHRAFPGEIAIAKMAEPVARATVISNTFPMYVIVADCIKFKPNSRVLDNNFIAYALNSTGVKSQAEVLSNGTTRIRINLGTTKILKVVTPPLPEQKAIADYLDTKTAQIDRKIDLLTQKATQYGKLKQSLINETVTRGLDKSVAMKDSGIEWIGEIPIQWEVTRNKDIFEERGNLSNSGTETLLTVSHITGVTRRTEKNVNMFMAETMEGYKLCEKGDLIINTMWAWMGALGTCNENGICSPAYGVYNPKKDKPYNHRYFDYLYRTPNSITEMTKNSKGIVSSRLRLYPKEFFQIKTALPNYAEQKTIADYLDSKTAHIDRIVETINTQIDKLKELRKTLINDVVTGKIKVA